MKKKNDIIDNYTRFTRFLQNVYGQDIFWYRDLGWFERNAVDIDYWNRYGVNPPCSI